MEPENPNVEVFARGIFKTISIEDEYNFLEKHLRGKSPADVLSIGGSSIDYAKRIKPGVFGMICEVPYIYDPRMFDETPLGISKKDLWTTSIERAKRALGEVEKFYTRLDPTESNPFKECVEYYLKFMSGRLEAEAKWVKTSKELLRPATIADTTRYLAGTIWYELLIHGTLYRMAMYEFEFYGRLRAKSLARSILRRAKKAYKEFMELANIRVVPIRRLIVVQLAAIMNTAKHLSRSRAT